MSIADKTLNIQVPPEKREVLPIEHKRKAPCVDLGSADTYSEIKKMNYINKIWKNNYAGSKDRDPETYMIIGLAMEVFNTIGCGFLEAVYQEALELEFINSSIPYEKEKMLPIYYKGKLLKTSYRADFICNETIIVELKAIKQITSIEEAQVINYLKVSRLHKALIINFGAQSLEFRRYIN